MTPEEEERVRRVLADAARPDGTEPRMPPEVADRLGDVIARLVDERSGEATRSTTSGVDELAERRRARRWPRVLVAAAAVCVVAFGAGTIALRNLETGSGDASTTQADGAADSRAESGPLAGDQGSAGGKALVPNGSVDSGRTASEDALRVPRLRSASLQQDLRRIAAGPLARRSTAPTAPDGAGQLSGRVGCTTPRLGRGEQPVDVRLDGAAATLVLSPVTGGAREARIYSCDDASRPVVTTRVPVG